MISKGSINGSNVFLQCEDRYNDDDLTIFAKKFLKVSKINVALYTYTNFINSIGSIISKLQGNGIDSLPYHAEMDYKSRYSNYMK